MRSSREQRRRGSGTELTLCSPGSGAQLRGGPRGPPSPARAELSPGTCLRLGDVQPPPAARGAAGGNLKNLGGLAGSLSRRRLPGRLVGELRSRRAGRAPALGVRAGASARFSPRGSRAAAPPLGRDAWAAVAACGPSEPGGRSLRCPPSRRVAWAGRTRETGRGARSWPARTHVFAESSGSSTLAAHALGETSPSPPTEPVSKAQESWHLTEGQVFPASRAGVRGTSKRYGVNLAGTGDPWGRCNGLIPSCVVLGEDELLQTFTLDLIVRYYRWGIKLPGNEIRR